MTLNFTLSTQMVVPISSSFLIDWILLSIGVVRPTQGRTFDKVNYLTDRYSERKEKAAKETIKIASQSLELNSNKTNRLLDISKKR